ncbi:MAG: LLM class flavin-dependent oxidoreductase [Candidatus Binataceae bacterium]|jgi:natural product biosynthesis luciferase-like monooxygenase protein
MQFDIFYQLPVASHQNTPQRYRELIEEAVEADRLGFGAVWLAEIHFMPKFCVLPVPMMLLAAIAERTNHIQLGQAVNLLPLHHPIRLAEEAATLDVISNGRLAFGAGRGGFPINYHGFGVDIRESRTMMFETIEFLKRAWTEDKLSYHSDRYNFDDVEIIPKPVQKPYPVIRVAANTPDTFSFAGAHGYPIFAGGPVNPINVIGERLKLYHQARTDAGASLPGDWFASLMMVFAGHDRASVRAQIEPSLRNYFHTVADIIRPETMATSGAEFDKVRTRMREMSYDTIDSLMGIFGDPSYCIDRITELRERFNFTRLVCWIEAGGLNGHENVLASMRLLAERVMPHFT